MALLSEKTRKARFDSLGLGEYNKTNIKKLQKKHLRPQDVDGVYGKDTDRLLRHLYNVKLCAPDFKPTEFKCECGGRYCTGYPTYMKRVELRHIQSIRDHYKKPMTVTCGLRCKTYNSRLSGSVSNSLHLVGRAVDFYMEGVTDTLANRKKAMAVLKARLLDQRRAAEEAKAGQNRRDLAGNGDRSQKIRTYNYPQNRITDHRINYTAYNLSGVMEGDLGDMLQALRQHDLAQRLEIELKD